MIGTTGKFCPLSPSRAHRVYYSARNSRGTAPVGRVACCRHCAVDVYLVAGQWQASPPGEILVGMCLEVDRILVESRPDPWPTVTAWPTPPAPRVLS